MNKVCGRALGLLNDAVNEVCLCHECPRLVMQSECNPRGRGLKGCARSVECAASAVSHAAHGYVTFFEKKNRLLAVWALDNTDKWLQVADNFQALQDERTRKNCGSTSEF